MVNIYRVLLGWTTSRLLWLIILKASLICLFVITHLDVQIKAVDEMAQTTTLYVMLLSMVAMAGVVFGRSLLMRGVVICGLILVSANGLLFSFAVLSGGNSQSAIIDGLSFLLFFVGSCLSVIILLIEYIAIIRGDGVWVNGIQTETKISEDDYL